MDKIDLVPDLKEQLKNYGKKSYPGECCGLLTGTTHKINNEIRSIPFEWHPIDNVSKEPYKWDYVMDPNQYMNVLKNTTLFNKKSAIELAAIFHTHPHNSPIPSQYDIIGAAWYTVYLIYGVSTDSMAAWFWNGVFFKKIPINEEQITQEAVYNDGEERNWKSWRDIGSL
jgi:proteasome lid subunit RPN8/RPN11